MGIRMLNKYLKEYSSNAMEEVTISELSGKKIAIDVSIFMYQFKGENTLTENMTKMIKHFTNNNITPIYVFDGRPPDEKIEVLTHRDNTKKMSKAKCDNIQNIITTNNNLSDNERSLLIDKLKNEKKNCLHITNANIRDVKKIMNRMGIPYLEAKGEADELCVYLVKKNFAWACITQDMDMFVYGCPRVLRNYSLKKDTMVLYTMTNILDNLHMTQADFTEVCSFCTDYNKTRFTIFAAMGLFYKYLRRKKGIITFYDWLIYTKVISINDKQKLLNVKKMFLIDINEQIKSSNLITKMI